MTEEPLVDVPDVRISEEHRREVLALLSRLEEERVLRGALLVGSLAAGLGHAHSDLDVIVVTPDDDLAPADLNYARAGRRIDVSWLTLSQVAAMIDEFAVYRAARTSRRQVMGEYMRTMTSVRVATGEVLKADDDLRRVLAGADRRSMAQALMVRAAIEVATYTEDVAGTVEVGDWPTAVDASAFALRKACDVLLTSAEDFYISDKFLLRRMLRCIAAQPILGRVWAALNAEIPLPLDARHAASLVEERLRLASALTSWTMVHGWDAPSGTPPLPRGEGPERNPYYTLLRFVDGFSVAGPNQGYSLAPGAARLFAELAGRPFGELLEQLPGQSASEEAVRKAVAAMTEQGLVNP